MDNVLRAVPGAKWFISLYGLEAADVCVRVVLQTMR